MIYLHITLCLHASISILLYVIYLHPNPLSPYQYIYSTLCDIFASEPSVSMPVYLFYSMWYICILTLCLHPSISILLYVIYLHPNPLSPSQYIYSTLCDIFAYNPLSPCQYIYSTLCDIFASWPSVSMPIYLFYSMWYICILTLCLHASISILLYVIYLHLTLCLHASISV